MFAKTMYRFGNFCWMHGCQDVKKYMAGCITSQQFMDSNQSSLTDLQTVKTLESRCRSLATEFIVGLLKTKDRSDVILTWVNQMLKRVHCMKRKAIAIAVEIADLLAENIFKHYGLPDNIVSDDDSKFCSKSWRKALEWRDNQLTTPKSQHPQRNEASDITDWIVENDLSYYGSNI